MNAKGRTRTISHSAIVDFAKANPTMVQKEIAAMFATSQSRVSTILGAVGIRGIKRGAPLKPKAWQTSEESQWEKVLHDAGLGMERGLRLKGKRILYGFDPNKESFDDFSATASQQITNPYYEAT